MQAVLAHEGGYTNNPDDPGGPTNYGITIYDARKYWRPNATADDVKAMPLSVAEDIYEHHYAIPLSYDSLPAGVDYCVLDYGINSGISRAAKVLQRCVGVKDDGEIGPVTLAAVKAHDPTDVIDWICDERLRFLKSLKTWPVFGKGWNSRVVEVRQLATQMVVLPAAHVAVRATPTPVHETMAKGFIGFLSHLHLFDQDAPTPGCVPLKKAA